MSNPIFTDGRIKIGKSKRNPNTFRKNELYSTGVPEPFRVEYFAFVEDYDSVELEIHKRLDNKRPNKDREFFTSTILEAVNTIREISKIINEENFAYSYLFYPEKLTEKFFSGKQTLQSRKYNVFGPGDGFEEEFWLNGQLRERINFSNGERHGLSEEFDSFGNKVSTATYKNGKLNGLAKFYYKQNHKSEKDVLLSKGNCIEHTSTGIDYENFLVSSYDGIWEWFYENGQISTRGSYKQYASAKDNIFGGAEEEGLWEWFYEDGTLKAKGNYKKGKQEGLWEWFYEGGNLKVRANYKKGKQEGLYEEFDEFT